PAHDRHRGALRPWHAGLARRRWDLAVEATAGLGCRRLARRAAAAGSGEAPMTPEAQSRRGFLFRLGIALNVLGAALVGIPVIGYVFGASRRRADGQSWIALGPVGGFPAGETRLATYENPVRVPWDGATAKVACWVRHIEGERFQVFAVNCAHLG